MENKRSNVLISILLIVLCLSVCVGLTYAYFTDSAKSNGNKIQAGNLKLDLKLYDKVDDEWISIKNTEDPVFNYEKWEPGYVDAKLLKIENFGDLAMQWEAKLVSTEAVSEFANAIEVYVQKSDAEIAYPADRAAALAWTKVGTLDQFINTAEKLASGTFTAQGEAYYIGIAFYMPAEITDNTLQGQVLGVFDIQINATQLAYESDAFDENYDDITIDSNGGVTPPGETESESDTTTSSSEPEPTEPQPEPTDPDIFTWSENGDGTYTVTGLVNPGTVANIVIPSTYNGGAVTAIGDDAFSYDYTITSVTIPDSVITIGDYAFADCSMTDNDPHLGLTKVIIGSGVTTIGDFAFAHCKILTELTIGNSVTIIGASAFEGCNGLTGELIIPDSVTTIGDSAFEWCYGLTGELVIPDSVTTIGNSAFYGCTGLTKLTIGNSVTTIGNSAFEKCRGLTDLTIGNSVTAIGEGAFNSCSGLTELTIGNSVTTIGDYAFYGCSRLTGELVIPNSVTAIGDQTFGSCSGLTSFVVDVDNTAYQAIDGNLYSKDGTVLVAYANGRANTNFTIPDGVITIGYHAFSTCTRLTSIEIPNSVTTIGDSAFFYCIGLTTVTIGSGVTTIGNSAFSNCWSLTSITFNGTVEQWSAISFGDDWNDSVPATEVVCSDGTVALN